MWMQLESVSKSPFGSKKLKWVLRPVLSTRMKVGLVAGCLVLVACAGHKFERSFISQVPARDRVDRLRQYSLEDQYRIYRYGNDCIEPPLMDLAEPIAERGATAVPFLLAKLDLKADDMTVRDVLGIFHMMAYVKAYNVKADTLVMGALRARLSTMKDAEWKRICSKTLQSIEEN
jgi:hypothetical protein